RDSDISDNVNFLIPLSKPPIIGSVPVHSRCLRSTIFTLFRFILNGKPDICVLSNTGTPFFMRTSTPLLCKSLHVEKLEIIFHTVSALASISVSTLTSELFMAPISGKYNARLWRRSAVGIFCGIHHKKGRRNGGRT